MGVREEGPARTDSDNSDLIQEDSHGCNQEEDEVPQGRNRWTVCHHSEV